MKKFTKLFALLLSLMMLAGAVTACGGSSDDKTKSTSGAADSSAADGTESTESTGNSAEASTITFGTNAEFPPFEFVTAKGVIDEFDGIDMAVAKQIAEDNNMTPRIENMEFDSLLLALENGQVDAIIAGMTITDEKAEAVSFSIPYYTAKQVMIVKEDSDIAKASDMADKKIVVIQGYTGEACVKKMGYEYEAFKKGSEAIMELVNGKCDVVVIDSATAEKYVKDTDGLKIVEDAEAFDSEEYGVAVKKENTELLEKINASLQKMLDEGTISELSAQYSEAE